MSKGQGKAHEYYKKIIALAARSYVQCESAAVGGGGSPRQSRSSQGQPSARRLAGSAHVSEGQPSVFADASEGQPSARLFGHTSQGLR